MTELPEISSSQGNVLTTINDNFQSVSPAAAFGIDWRNTEELTLGVFGGIAPDGTEKADATLALSASNTNYVEMTTAGVVSSNTSAYTAGRVKLFRIVTNANGISSYIDDRSFSPGGISVSGPSSATDNAVARFDGATGKLLQNSVVTISDLGDVAGAISLSIGGALTAAQLQQTGTVSSAIAELAIVNATHASTVTSTQYGLDYAPRFSIPGGAVTTIYGVRFNPRVDATANNVTNFYAASLQLIKSAGHTGTISNGANFRSETPSLGGGTPITTFTQFLGEANSTNGAGITSGSVTNRGLHIAAISVAAGAGGTVTNVAGSLTVPSGSAAGNTNYGLRITGNGGAASTNWAIHSDSTAVSAIAGNVRIGSTTAPTVALDVTGSAAISTNLNVTGVSGLGVASSSTTAVIVPASVAGVSSLRIPHGTAPSSPVNGDVWTTTAGIFVRINGATVGPLS